MKKDPMGIVLGLLTRLNLLEENREYNINELKEEFNLHWATTNKYIKIAELIQKYCPIFEVNGAKVKINKSKFQRILTEKEKFVLYLFNEDALDKNNAIAIDKRYDNEEIKESIGYLYNKDMNKFYLTEAGKSIFRSLNDAITDIIFNDKEFCQKEESGLTESINEDTIQKIEIKIRIEYNVVINSETSPKLNYMFPIDSKSINTSGISVNN